MNGILVILFPNGQMQIACDNFFPCQQQYIRMLDKVISLSDEPQNLRLWLTHYLENRVYTESNDKVKARLKKNFDFMCTRYSNSALRSQGLGKIN